MKILLFSDTHFHKKFEAKKFNFLKKIISDADKVIIVGDFWEGNVMTFDEFVSSEWNMLFPLLKEKQTVYIYGNHDPKKSSDSRVALFSDEQTLRYRFTSGGRTFVCEHGNRLYKDTLLHTVVFKSPLTPIFRSKLFTVLFHTKFESFLVTHRNEMLKTILYPQWNERMIEESKKEFRNGEILICGHSHVPLLDLENRYINTGMVRHGIGWYVVIENDEITLHKDRYERT